MLRIGLGAIVGFFAWAVVWFGIEQGLSAVLPEWYGAPQRAFQDAVENGGQFGAETRLLLAHLVIGSIVSIIAGFVSVLVAGENKRAPLVLGLLLLGLGLLKAVISWPYVPIWYHAMFTAILLPMAVLGGKLKGTD